MRFLLLHPPVLSPAVWRRVSASLAAAGHEVAAPDLRPGPKVRGWWREVSERAVSSAPDTDVVVAHSGAGPLVPVVCAATPYRAAVLVDAVLPAASGVTLPSGTARAQVASLAVDGLLPPWTSWWGDEVLAELVPDRHDRDALSSSAARLPEAFWDEPVDVPDGWEPPLTAYVQLSPAYADHAAAARDRDWPVTVLDGRHLDVLRRPGTVTAAVLALLTGT